MFMFRIWSVKPTYVFLYKCMYDKKLLTRYLFRIIFKLHTHCTGLAIVLQLRWTKYIYDKYSILAYHFKHIFIEYDYLVTNLIL